MNIKLHQHLILLLAMAVFSSYTQASDATVVTLRMHQFLPAKANIPRLVLQEWADRVQRDSAGRIKIEHYPSMQLGGNPTQLYDQVIQGIADIIWVVNGYTPGRLPAH